MNKNWYCPVCGGTIMKGYTCFECGHDEYDVPVTCKKCGGNKWHGKQCLMCDDKEG